jgi:hypothetical protein
LEFSASIEMLAALYRFIYFIVLALLLVIIFVTRRLETPASGAPESDPRGRSPPLPWASPSFG